MVNTPVPSLHPLHPLPPQQLPPATAWCVAPLANRSPACPSPSTIPSAPPGSLRRPVANSPISSTSPTWWVSKVSFEASRLFTSAAPACVRARGCFRRRIGVIGALWRFPQVRPFTLGQLKELLNRTGTVVEEGFWIDKIKSHCIVTVSTVKVALVSPTHTHTHKTRVSVGTQSKQLCNRPRPRGSVSSRARLCSNFVLLPPL